MTTQYDLLAINGAGTDSPKLTSQSLFSVGNSGLVCSGIQKLAQTWLITFLTPLGSMGFHLSSVGTNFLLASRSGQLSTESSLVAEFGFAALMVSEQLNARTPANAPADERLQSAVLEDALLEDDKISLRIRLTSEAGSEGLYVVPISATPESLSAQSTTSN